MSSWLGLIMHAYFFYMQITLSSNVRLKLIFKNTNN